MLDRRAARIVWSFLLGVILVEGWVLWISFARGGLPAVVHYLTARPGTPLAWVAAALAVVLYAASSARSSGFIAAQMLHPALWRSYAWLRAAAIPMALVSGFFEEAFFRRTLMDLVQNHGASPAAQIAVSALAFGAVHALWGVMGGSLRGALGAMMATTVLGAALAAIYLLGGRAIAPCIAAHTLINLLIEPWLIIAAVTGQWSRDPAARAPRPA